LATRKWYETNGSNLHNLTNTGENHSPSWSPDGTRIVFSSARDDLSHLYVIHADGTQEAQLTNYQVFIQASFRRECLRNTELKRAKGFDMPQVDAEPDQRLCHLISRRMDYYRYSCAHGRAISSASAAMTTGC
jgi:WD40-like Beta Propeller Repeat